MQTGKYWSETGRGTPWKKESPLRWNATRGSWLELSSGRPRSLKLEVFCDENNDSAPVHKMSNNRDLVMLEANLTHISRSDMDSTIKVGEDGQRYYVVAGAFYLASTKYMLTCRGKRYDTVMAEYI